MMKEFTPPGIHLLVQLPMVGPLSLCSKNGVYIKLLCSNGCTDSSNGFKTIKNPYFSSVYSQKGQKMQNISSSKVFLLFVPQFPIFLALCDKLHLFWQSGATFYPIANGIPVGKKENRKIWSRKPKLEVFICFSEGTTSSSLNKSRSLFRP